MSNMKYKCSWLCFILVTNFVLWVEIMLPYAEHQTAISYNRKAQATSLLRRLIHWKNNLRSLTIHLNHNLVDVITEKAAKFHRTLSLRSHSQEVEVHFSLRGKMPNLRSSLWPFVDQEGVRANFIWMLLNYVMWNTLYVKDFWCVN